MSIKHTYNKNSTILLSRVHDSPEKVLNVIPILLPIAEKVQLFFFFLTSLIL